jgi:hypothetical protein
LTGIHASPVRIKRHHGKSCQWYGFVLADNGSGITVSCNSLSDTTTDTLNVVAKAVSGISVTSNPTKLSYVVGESLDYAGMVVQLEYNDGSTVSDILPTEFDTYAIAASPASGTNVSLLHNSTSIQVSCNSYTASTSLLTVVNKEVTQSRLRRTFQFCLL